MEDILPETPALLGFRAKDGASGRTRTDEYEFTKLVLWLLRHRGKVASTAGLAPATSTFARWRGFLTKNEEKRRTENDPVRRTVTTQSAVSHSAICILHSAFKMVVPAGNAPASSGYQPGAL